MFSHSDGLKKLARLTGNRLSDLLSLLYLPANSNDRQAVEGEYNFYGVFLNRSVIRPHCPKVCPRCLINFGHCLRVWDCSLVTVCPIHECMLIDSCPECKRRVRYVRNKLSICSCGCDWRETNPTALTDGQLAVSRRIYQLCGMIPGKKSLHERDSPLGKLGLRDFTLVMVFIAGLYGKLAWPTGRPSRSIKLRNTELHTLFTKAHEVFEHWPHNFHQFLRAKSKGKKRFNPHGGELDTALKREFGSFYEKLYQDLCGRQFDFMREAFAEFLTNRVKSQSEPKSTVPSVPASGSESYISVAQARRLLKTTHRTMFDLVTTGEIDFVIRNEGTSLRYLLRLSDVEKVKFNFEQAISSRTLANQLGVACKMIHRLAKEGYLQTKSRRAVDGYHTIKFDADAAEKLLKTLPELPIDLSLLSTVGP